jgi:uncharacterized protein (TIGR04141 family)
MDRLTDLVSAVGGRTAGEIPSQVFGSKPLRSRESIGRAEDLVDLARTAVADYRSRAYEDRFAFIDDYVPVEDDEVIARLKARLFRDIQDGHDNVDVFLPDDLVDFEDERAIVYILFPTERVTSAARVTLTVDELRARLPPGDVGPLDWTLRFCDAGKEVVADASVLECLAADLELPGGRYLVSDGDFFRVDQGFLEGVDAQLDALAETSLRLPCYRGGVEGRWNAEAADAGRAEFVSLDGKMIRIEGETPFEAADLVHVSGALVHAKRKGRSSALSYLFAQATRSCQLLTQIPEAAAATRREVKVQALDEPTGRRIGEALAALDNRWPQLEVIIAILGDWHNRSLRNLPLLAKIGLVESARQITRLGFNPSVALVNLCSR